MEMTTTTISASALRSLLPQFHLRSLASPPSPPSPSPSKLRAPLPTARHSSRHLPLLNPIYAAADHISASASSTTQVMQLDQAFEVKKRAAEISGELKGTSIFLVGMKSNIKTSMGKILADALRYYYFDSDELVEDAAGADAGGKSFRERDEEGFCSSETEVLKQLSSMGRLVVCAGDGAVQSSTNLALLRHGISVCIDLPMDIIANNLMESLGGSASEMDRDKAVSQLIVQYNENKSGYANSDVTVSLQKVALELGYEDMEMVTEEDMALEVIKEIEKLTRVKKLLEDAARPF
uniref:Inactive shikimate kinase like 1, chloroplastic n=1 Tax=Kalanchoe fedtschenkoi TaxID=63787 RepID=A0A7N1A294_KALFE